MTQGASILLRSGAVETELSVRLRLSTRAETATERRAATEIGPEFETETVERRTETGLGAAG